MVGAGLNSIEWVRSVRLPCRASARAFIPSLSSAKSSRLARRFRVGLTDRFIASSLPSNSFLCFLCFFVAKTSGTTRVHILLTFVFIRKSRIGHFGDDNRKLTTYSAATPPKNEAGRLVRKHKADPVPSTFLGKDEGHDYSY